MRAAARSPLPWLGGLLALYLIAPFAALAGRLDGGVVNGARAAPVVSALRVSAESATISTVLIALGGVPLAYLFARSRSRLLSVVEIAVYLPLALPPLVSGILLLFLVGPYTTVGGLFGGRLTDSLAGIVIAQTFVAAPFLVVAARSAFSAVDPSLEQVAATLGHRPLVRFVRVSLRLAAPGILAGMLLAWLRAFGEFGATVMVAYHPYTLPVYTYVAFSGGGLTLVLAPVLVAVVAALLLVTAARLLRPAAAHARRRPLSGRPARATAAGRTTAAAPLAFDLEALLDGFHLSVRHSTSQRRLALLGPSGAGKSLTLRLLAGIERRGRGRVSLGGVELSALPPERRSIAYVPQDYGLFPHLPVSRQVLFGAGADPALAAHWLGRLGLDGLERRYPAELSGGQQQRVALARALSLSPRLLLLDEPLSSLDAPARAGLGRELRGLQQELELPSVLVTHDIREAALLADELIVLHGGRIVQTGPVSEVYEHPASPLVAGLLGIPNLHEGRIAATGVVEAGGVLLPVSDCTLPVGRLVSWCIHPERVRVRREGTIAGTVVDVVELGGASEATLRIGRGLELLARPGERLRTGEKVGVSLPAAAIRVWPAREPAPRAFESPPRDGEPLYPAVAG